MDGEGKTFADAAADLDHHLLTVGEDSGHDVTAGELLAQRIGSAIDFDLTSGIDAADEGDATPRQGKVKSPAVIPIRSQGEAGWQCL